MDTYSFLRQLADSWVLLALFAVFAGVVFWAFRPGSRGLHDEAAHSIFTPEDAPRAPRAPRQDRADPVPGKADTKIGEPK